MVSKPGEEPVTTPPLLTVALELVALHTPPDTLFDKVTGAPGQTDDAPDIVPVLGAAPIVTATDATDVPQVFVTV